MSNNMRNCVFIVAGFLFSPLSTLEAKPIEPGNWDRVRLYGHGNENWGFSEEDYQFIKDNYWLVTIEKTHGQNVYGKGQTDLGSIDAAARIKADNPDGQVMYYWNANKTWEPLYASVSDILTTNPTWEKDDVAWDWDVGGSDLFDWWVSTAVDMVNNSGHDGVFVDGGGSTKRDPISSLANQVDGLVIYNGIWMTGAGEIIGTENMEISDGYYCESFFCHKVNSSERAILYMDTLLAQPTDKYALCVGNNNTVLNPDPTFSLACYLIVAHDKSFFKWLQGGDPNRFIWWTPEYGYRLGKPKGPAKKENNVYTRSFEFCDVSVDLNALTSNITWHSAETKPVAHFNLNEAVGSQVADSSGYQNDATIASGTWVTPGIHGSALHFDGSGSDSVMSLPASTFDRIDDQITISLWQWGSSAAPEKSSALYAENASGKRVLNIHLPWDDSKVYWDAGTNGVGFDRISKIATTTEYNSGWHNWVFTKNASTGLMEIYHDGELWHSGSNMSKEMTGITSASIGAQISSFSYDGSIDDVKIFNVALDAEEIASMYDNTLDHLQAYLPLNSVDSLTSATADQSGKGNAASASNVSIVEGVEAQAFEFNGSDSAVSLPGNVFVDVENEVSVAMWINGNAAMQPRKNSIFYAVNGEGDRVLNIHLPWDDSKVYWDAGNSDGFDRMSKAASTSEFAGQWNHWVFTKNVSTGSMKIYLNGVLWSSATGKIKTMAGITEGRLGSAIGKQHYAGVVDDLLVFSRELTPEEITALYASF